MVAQLLGDEAVRRHWDDESSCAGMTVGGLAHHLRGQLDLVHRLLGAPPTDDDPIPVREHYRRAAWLHQGLDHESNVGIREGSNEKATPGPDELAELVRADLAALPAVLAPVEAGDRVPDQVHIPWQGWSLTTQDFLATRLMEMVVHADDLAAGLGLPTPDFPDPVVEAVVALLASVALDQHGQTAVVRALSRPQRAPGSVSAF